MCKFCRCTTSTSSLNSLLLIFQICTLQWLNCTNLTDYLNCSYNGGGVVYLLQIELSTSTLQYKKQQKLQNVYIYIKLDTSQKPGKFVIRFYWQKATHFIEFGKSIFFTRVRKFFIFYNFRKHIACVGAYDGLTSGSGFIWLDSLKHPPVEINGEETVLYGLFDPRFKF